MAPGRKCHGEGRASIQKKQGIERQDEIAGWLIPLLDLERVERTGTLFPRGTIKKVKVKAIFHPWISQLQGRRILTTALCRAVVRSILGQLQFVPPRDPKMSLWTYVCMQGRRFQTLARSAKRLGSLKVPDPSEADTLPFEAVPRPHSYRAFDA